MKASFDSRLRALGADDVATISGRADDEELALEAARDAVAAAALLQYAGATLDPLNHVFATARDAISVTEWHLSERGKTVGLGIRRHGRLGDWTLTGQQIADYGADPRFQFLDAALSAQVGTRTDLQNRVVLAARMLHLARSASRPQTQIALLGVVFDGLLGDAGAKSIHRICQRGAYLTCGPILTALPRHGAARPACPYMTAGSERALRNALRQRAVPGRAPQCSLYEHSRVLFDARNEALHDGREDFLEADRRRFIWWTSTVLLHVLDWAAAKGASQIGDLDAEIASIPPT